jgi:hypothetical protein
MLAEQCWHKATASEENGCVEVAHNTDEGMVLVRDSKRPGGGVVAFTAAEWASLLQDVAAGHFHWSRFHPLRFDRVERAAFEAGVVAEEFELPEAVLLYPELGDDLKRAGEQMARHKAGQP